MAGTFLKIKFRFAGTHPCTLTINGHHVASRWNMRIASRENPLAQEISAKQCLVEIAKELSDKRLSDIYVRTSNQFIVLFLEHRSMYIFLCIKNKEIDGGDVRVSTVLNKREDSNLDTRCLVEKNDLCYILPVEGNLRFGKEKKYFKFKK